MKRAERVAEDPGCDGLLVGVASLALARRIVATTLPGRWTVDLLGPGSTVVEARRAGRDRRIRLSTAWNHCARLRAAPEIRFAEPSLTTVGHDPDPLQAARILAPFEHGLAPESRLAGDGPLPCAEQNRHWSLQLCRVPDAWALQPPTGGRSRGAGIVIGHPDTGYTRHPEVWDAPRARIRAADGWDFEDDDPGADDPLVGGFLRQPGHGTATSSVIMSTVLAEEVTGVAPEAELIPIRVTKSVVLFGFAKLARALYHAVDRGAHVISISLGGPVRSRALDEATAWAASQGVVVLAAAGNIWPFVIFPARLPQVIGVGACNCDDEVWKKSARGSGVDVSAPGEGVWRAGVEGSAGDPEYSTGMGYGTSFAVATCAGAAALWLAHHGRERLLERYGPAGLVTVFRGLLLDTARVPDPWDPSRDGVGILDAEALLRAPLPEPPGAEWSPQAMRPESTAPPIEAIAAYLPEEDPDEVRIAALAWLGRGSAAAGARHWPELGDEVLFQLATNPELRAELRRKIRRASTLTPQSLPDSPSPAFTRIRRQGSHRLREQLHLAPRLRL